MTQKIKYDNNFKTDEVHHLPCTTGIAHTRLINKFRY
jgi:hypothetical protein